MDKAMAEIEHPKMIVCFEKEVYELVKDVCVDNGVQSVHRISSLKGKVDDLKIDAAYRKGKWTDSDDVVPGFDNLNTFLMNEQSISDAHNGPNKQQLRESENHGETKIVSEPVSFLTDGRTNDRCGDEACFSTLGSTTDGLARLYGAKDPKLQCSDDVNHPDSSKRDSSKEANTQESSAYSRDEPGTRHNSRDYKYRDIAISEMDSENMKLHVNEAPENETERTLAPPQHGHLRDVNPERSDGLTAEARSSLVHYGFADASLFGQHTMPNSISFSGQAAYKGSTSLRSDSSTTSTSSFAFPVLQSEWNSSPEKMAKADRKHYRRQRCRNCFLCCRF